MSINYTALAATALRLITEFGRDLTFTKDTEGAYNPATGKYATTSATYTKKVAVTQYKATEYNDIIQKGDLKLVAESYAYAMSDTVSIDSEVYRIIDIKQLKPAATEVAVIMQVRK